MLVGMSQAQQRNLDCRYPYSLTMNKKPPSSTMEMVSPAPSRCSSDAVEINIEMAPRLILFSHEFPSGDIEDLFRRLHRRSKLRRFPLLARFLQESTIVLQQEVQNLPGHIRNSVPPFHDLNTLVSHLAELKESLLGGTWEGALLCVYEVAMLIGLVFFFLDIDLLFSPSNLDQNRVPGLNV